jgi:hypothetical protein
VSLSSGTRLGVYEIIEQIGAGGMGDVCRARDSRLFPLTLPADNQGSFDDVAPDGERFLVIVPQQLKGDAAPRPPTSVLNWVARPHRQN